MSNPLPLDRLLRVPMVDPKTGMLTKDWAKYLGWNEQRVGPALSPGVMQPSGASNVQKVVGQIQSTAKVQNRTEGIGTTLQNVTATGQLNSLLNVVADRSTDNIADGTGSPLTGGKRGFQALDTNNRLANSFRANPVNVSNTPTSSTTLSNDGISTAIPISGYTSQFPPGSISYNSGSVDPGSFTKSYIYFDDPTFSGGAVAFQFSATPQTLTAAEGRCIVGSITTVGGSAKTGGGSSGGTGGTGGGRGTIQG